MKRKLLLIGAYYLAFQSAIGAFNGLFGMANDFGISFCLSILSGFGSYGLFQLAKPKPQPTTELLDPYTAPSKELPDPYAATIERK